MDSEVPASPHERLESWKEIAGYLKRDVRTVQRWEQSKNLPVHRLPGKHGAVYAWKSELETWRNGEKPEATRRTRPFVMALGIAALLAGVLPTTVWLLRRESAPAEASRAPIPLTSFLGDEEYPSFSPDGAHVAFAWEGPHRDNFDIYVKPVGTGETLRVSSDPAYETSPVWSPDGRFIAFLRRLSNGKEAVILIPAFGGEERRLSESYQSPLDPVGPFLAWMPDSRWLVVARRPSSAAPYELNLVSLADGKSRRLTTPPAHSWGDAGPALSPDGKRLVFTRTRSIGIGELLLQTLSNKLEVVGEPQRVPIGSTYPNSPVWISDNEIVFSSGFLKDGRARLFRLSTDFSRLKATDQVASQRLPFGEGILFPAFSPKTGHLAYVRAFSDRNIWRLSLADKTARPETFLSSSGEDNTPKFSPDGRSIGFGSSRSGSMEIWLADSDGSHPTRLTSFGGPLTGSPAWSPDSRTIAFDSVASGHPDIYTVSAQGGTVRRLTTSPANEAVPSWSPDGRWIYFNSNRTGKDEIWRVSAFGGEAVPMHIEGFNPAVSPDGRFIYFMKTPHNNSLWRIPSQGGDEELVLEHVASRLSLSVGKKGIHFVGGAAPGMLQSVRFLSFKTGKIQTIITLEKAFGFGLAVSPDEKVLLYTQLDQAGSDLMVVESFR
jgi:Tol biopolymer transport system component